MDIKAFYTSYYLQLLFYVNMYNFSKGKLKDKHNDLFKKKMRWVKPKSIISKTNPSKLWDKAKKNQ